MKLSETNFTESEAPAPVCRAYLIPRSKQTRRKLRLGTGWILFNVGNDRGQFKLALCNFVVKQIWDKTRTANEGAEWS